LDNGNFLCHAQVAPEAQFSFTGRLILAHHHNLHLKVCTTFGNSNPELISPMTLYSAPQQSQMQQMNIYAPNEEGVLQASSVQQLTQLPQQQSPEAWEPVIAQEMTLPVMAYRPPMEGDPEKINPDFPSTAITTDDCYCCDRHGYALSTIATHLFPTHRI